MAKATSTRAADPVRRGRVSALHAGFRPCTRQTPRDPAAARESAVRVRKHDDRESEIPGEGALVDGRRPGPVKPMPLTRWRRRWIGQLTVIGSSHAQSWLGFTRGCWRGRQRLCRMLGPRLKTPGSGGSAQRSSRSKLHQDCAGSDDQGSRGSTSEAPISVAAEAEAGGSPSSEAPLGDSSQSGAGVPTPIS